MARCLLILIIITTPCFAQGLGNMSPFGGMSSPPGSFQGYGNNQQSMVIFIKTTEITPMFMKSTVLKLVITWHRTQGPLTGITTSCRNRAATFP